MNTPAQKSSDANKPPQVRQRQPIELEHAKSFLDIILGVIITVPLPELVRRAFNLAAVLIRRPLDQTAVYLTIVPLLLTTSTLILITFYWLEVRQFIDRQIGFNKKLATTEDTSGEGVHLGRSRLLGAIILITVLVAILEFARSYEFRLFLLANFLFWIFDLAGNYLLRQSYKIYIPTIDKIQTEITIPAQTVERRVRIRRKEDPLANYERVEKKGEYQWFIDHLRTKFFTCYSSIYACLFAIMLCLDCFIDQVNAGGTVLEIYRIIAALFVLSLTLIGHLYIRVEGFENDVKRRQEASSS